MKDKILNKKFSITSVLIASHASIACLAVVFSTLIGFIIASKNTQELLHDKGDLLSAILIKQVSAYFDKIENDAESIADIIKTGNVQNFNNIKKTFLSVSHHIYDIKFIKKSSTPSKTLEKTFKGNWGKPYLYSGLILWNYTKDIHRRDIYLGTLTLSININSLKTVLNNSIVHHNQKAFVFYESDYILIPPGDIDLPKNKERHSLPKIHQANDTILSSVWSKNRITLIPNNGKHHIGESHNIDIVDGSTVFLYAILENYGEVPLLVGSYFPFSTINQQLKRIDIYIILGGLVIAISLFLAIILGRNLSNPIKTLSNSAHLIGKLEFKQIKTLPKSRLKELNDASIAFNEMSIGLKTAELYMPKNFLQKLLMVGENHKILSESTEVTIMFTDIISFTSLAEKLTPEETVNMLNEHFSIITKCIEEEEGTVDKFIGDAVLAFWGAPEKQEDQAERACRAALKIYQILNKPYHKKTPIRIGIHKGVAIVGNIGSPTRINYTVTGDTVNIAQRLQEVGKEFSRGKSIIIVSSTVINSTKNHYNFRKLGEKKIRGRKNSMLIYELVH